MKIKEQIDKNYLESYKAHDEAKVAVLRVLKGDLQNTEIAKKADLADEDVTAIIKKQIKQRQDTILIYKNSGKDDAVLREQEEIDILSQYLPAQLSEDETRKIVQDTINELEIADKSQIGKLIGTVVSKNKNSIDGALVARIASELLPTKN